MRAQAWAYAGGSWPAAVGAAVCSGVHTQRPRGVWGGTPLAPAPDPPFAASALLFPRRPAAELQLDLQQALWRRGPAFPVGREHARHTHRSRPRDWLRACGADRARACSWRAGDPGAGVSPGLRSAGSRPSSSGCVCLNLKAGKKTPPELSQAESPLALSCPHCTPASSVHPPSSASNLV